MGDIINTIFDFWKAGRKSYSGQSGWVTANAVCCQHRGERADTRKRGGMIVSGTQLGYHCFNCGFAIKYTSGTRISNNLSNLMNWMGMPDDDIQKIKMIALAQSIESGAPAPFLSITPVVPRNPSPGVFICDLIEQENSYINDESMPYFEKVVEYLYDERKLDEFLGDIKWSNDPKLRDGFIMPVSWNSDDVGYILRSLSTEPKARKYISDFPSGVLYGLDTQPARAKSILVFEGVIDALKLGGVSIMTNIMSGPQSEALKATGKQIIIVPDRDSAGKKAVESAVANGFSMAFPEWEPGIKDADEACTKYGIAFTMASIFNTVKSTEFSIKLAAKMWF